MMDIGGMLAVISLGKDLVKEVIDLANKHREIKRLKESLFKGLEDEYQIFIENFNNMMEFCYETWSKIENYEEINTSFFEYFLESYLKILEKFNTTIDSLIKLAAACSQIYEFEAFMDIIKKKELYVLHTFIFVMKDSLIRKNKIRIDVKFLRFFKMFYNDLVKDKIEDKVNEEEIRRLISKAKKFVEDFKSYIERNKRMLKYRRTRKIVNDINSITQKIIKKVEVPKDVNKNLKNYIPKNLVGIVIILEELTLSEISK